MLTRGKCICTLVLRGVFMIRKQSTDPHAEATNLHLKQIYE